jgi:3-oxoacyl-[acyl-carrier protein] reductase
MSNTSFVILITGTSKGIGRYLVEYYVNKGYFVVGCSRSDSDFINEKYTHFKVDITDESEILGLFKEIKNKFSKLDILINNAAINPAIISAALISSKTIDLIYKTNVFAPIILCREAVKIMARNRFGRIINFGSMATRHEVPGEALYTSTKASINAYSRVLAKEVAKSNITVNVIAPSVIKTDLSSKINQLALNEILSRNAIKQYGDLADISNSIDFLIQKECNSITGQIIYLGGV